jgi:predicted DNA-binding protein YlxM (UPF0122 family)
VNEVITSDIRNIFNRFADSITKRNDSKILRAYYLDGFPFETIGKNNNYTKEGTRKIVNKYRKNWESYYNKGIKI